MNPVPNLPASGNTLVTDTRQNTALPDSTQAAQPKLSTRAKRDLMLQDPAVDDDVQNRSEQDHARADESSESSENGHDHLRTTAEKTKAAKPQNHLRDKRKPLPEARIQNGGDYAIKGYASRAETDPCCCDPCILV
jgi:hypothetical protein